MLIKQIKANLKYILIIVVLVGGWIIIKNYTNILEESSSPTTQSVPEKDAEDISGWQIYRNDEFGFEVKYPQKLDTQFIRVHSPLPPDITIENSDPGFVCEQREEIINNNHYCVQLTGDAAAGTAYHDYQYIMQREGKQIQMRFTLAYPNCGAYYGIDNKQQVCEEERAVFNPDFFADQMLSTFRFID